MGAYGIGTRAIIFGFLIILASACIWTHGAYLPHSKSAIAEFQKEEKVYKELEAIRGVTRSMGIRVDENARLGLSPEQRGRAWKMSAYASSGFGFLMIIFGWVLRGAGNSTTNQPNPNSKD